MEPIKQANKHDDVDLMLQRTVNFSNENDGYYDDIPTGVEVEVIEDYSCVAIGEDGNWYWKRP